MATRNAQRIPPTILIAKNENQPFGRYRICTPTPGRWLNMP